ncbi:MAG: amidase, partial [Chloroflexi bacterium]|nr:amidase [Chloroflexota bacterium]
MQTMQELHTMTISELAPLIASKQVSPVEVTETLLERIERYNPLMRIYITITRELAMAQAKAVEAAIRAGDYRGPMHGVPISLKDNIATKGIRTTGASLVKRNWIPTEDAGVTTKLAAAGTVLVGKANLGELAFGGMHAEYGAPINPWSLEHSAAGSSSGSGAGVSCFMAFGSVGTDTGGSIRGPANNNGCVGLKPTYGLVSRYGVIPASWSLDHCGPLTRTARDNAIMLQAMAGHDPRDGQSSAYPTPDFVSGLTGDLTGLRIGIVTGFPIAPTEAVA